MAKDIVFRVTDDQESSFEAFLEGNGSKESISDWLTKYLSDHVHQVVTRHPRGAIKDKINQRAELDKEIREMSKVASTQT